MASLYKRGGVYYSNVRIKGHAQADAQGRVRIPLDADKGFAEKKLANLVLRKHDARYGTGVRGISWEEWKKIWLAFSEKKHPRETYLRHAAAIKLLERLVPITRLDQLTNQVLENLTGDMRTEGYEPAGINRVLGSIRTMLSKAHEWKYVDDLGWDDVTRERLTKKIPKYYTLAEYAVLVGVAVEEHWRTTCVLGFNLGLRRAELYHASVKDVVLGAGTDADPGHFWVHAKPGFTPKEYEEGKIELNPSVRAYLVELLKRLPSGDAPLLGRGRPVTLSSYTTGFRKVLARANLPGSLRNLRHCFGAYLAIADVNMRKIQKLMRHKSLKATEIYTELYPDATRGAVRRLPALDVAAFVADRAS